MIFTQAKEDVGWKEDFQLGCDSYSKNFKFVSLCKKSRKILLSTI